MSAKFDYYSALAEDTASHLTKSREQWTAFLRTAGRVSKYTYEEQLMIFAQRPDATACAEYDLWNSTMRRYVKRGAKGIALIDNSWDRPRLRYVFDVSDTGARKNSREVNLWHMKDEYVRPVQAALEAAFEESSFDPLDEQIGNIADEMAYDYWQDHEQELTDIVADSFLEEYDDDNRRLSFLNAASVSIKYEILSRCVADPDEYFEPDEFAPIFDYNTSKAVNALGTAVSESSGRVFREIEVTIRNYERSRRTERSQDYGTELYAERGLSDPEHRIEGERREAAREVRQDAQGVPEREPSDPVQRPVADGAAVSAPEGDRRDSAPEAGPDDGGTAYEEPGIGQEDPSDGVGAAYEQPESAGGGDHYDGTGVQLTDEEPDSAGVSSEDIKEDTISEPVYEQMTLFFPTEAEQIKAIDQEAESEMPSAFSIPQSDIDNVLRLGGSSDKSRMVVAAEYMKGKSVTELAAFLRTEYRGGIGIFTGSERLSVWFADDGIWLAPGDYARNAAPGMFLPWEDAAERIGELLDDGQFATNVEIEETPGYARARIAQALWYLRSDFSEIAREAGLLSSLEPYRGGFPDETERLAEALGDPEVLAAVTRDMMIFTRVYEQRPEVLRFHYHRVPELYRSLRELGMTWREYSSDMIEVPQPGYFITEDEIDMAFAYGSLTMGGKERIYSYFTDTHSAKELVDFLRGEYGIGGRSGAFINDPHSSENYDGKGFTFRKSDCIPVKLSWSNAAKRITALIKDDRYLTAKEKQKRTAVRPEEQKPALEELATEDQQAKDVVYEFVTVNGTPALFSNGRIKEGDIPAGLFRYELRGYDDDPGDPYCVEERVLVNHAGNIVTATPLPIPESGYIPLKEENEGLNFLGWDMGIREFQRWYQLKAEARECLEQFLPRVVELVMADSAYRNACKNSDAENVEIELGYAIGRAINSLKDVDLYRFYYDDADFHKHMDEDVFDETYYNLRPRLPHELKTEQTEDDPFPDIDPVEIREELERRGIVNGELVDADKESPFVRQVMADVERIAAEEAKETQMLESEAADDRLMSGQEDTAERNTEESETLSEDAASLTQEDRFHVIETEFGNDGAYSIWDDQTGDYYVDTDGNHVYFSDRWAAEDYRDELTERAQEEAARSPLDRAKELLDEYCMEEFSEPADFDDMSRIGIGYTTITDEDIPIEASVNLEEFKLERFLNGVLFDTRQYGSLEELVSKELEYLDFDKLMDATDDEIEEVMSQTEKASELPAKDEEVFEYQGYHFRAVGRFPANEDFQSLSRQIRSHASPYMATYEDSEIKYSHDEFYKAAENSEADIFLCLETGTICTPGRNELFEYFGEYEPYLEPEKAVSEELAADKQEQGETQEFPYHVGDTVYLENGKAFLIESIGMFDVQLRDPSLSYPVFRAESRENFLRLMERYSQDRQPEVAEETVVVYPGEKTRLPYDVEIRRMRFDEPEQELSQNDTPELTDSSKGATELTRSQVPECNFRITDDHLGEGGPKQKYARNVEAIRTLFMLEEEKRNATPEEQEILSQYVGWGGIADAFDPNKTGWEQEYQELKTLLPEHEYEMARGSTLNAHYTSPTVIKAIYEAVGNMGFTGGNILEPSMGVGNFLGLLPDAMAGSRLYGVELDSITGRIAQKLYPQADIKVAGFETTDRRDFYDLAVGNVPFGQYKVSDKPYDKLGFSIHNYFFAKALDQVRPGGVVAFVTSRYTMDAKSPDVRRYLAQRAELLGAIRLPNNAFKANAGTEVVSDIIFLQKRDHPIDIEQDWIHLDLSQEGYPVNRYFVDHPEMILGTLTEESTQYGMDITVAPIPGAELSEQLHEAVSHIHGSYQTVEMEYEEAEESTKVLPADPDVKNYSFTVVDGEVYFRENSVMRLVELNETAKARVKGLVELRKVVNELIDYQMEDYPEEDIHEKQEELNTAYDAYTAKYGLINSRGNAQAFSDDSSYYLLCSLENIDEDGQLISKADMFTKRTIRPERKVTSVDTPSEALAVSIGEHGKVDLPYMAELLGTLGEYASITEELRGVIFKDPMASDEPEAGWQTADEYLSGNVREKLRIAQMAAEKDSAFSVNVDALTKAQPKELEASEIDVRLGATWVDKRYIQQFMQETFELPFYLRRSVEVKFSPLTAEWQVTGKSSISRNDVVAYATYGTERANAYRILEDTLNLKDVRIYDTIEDIDGKQKRVLNKKETTLAQQKQQAIKDAFQEWVWKDPARREALCKKYNELFNSTRPREYDGSHIRFGGMNPDIKLRPHQQNAIAHVLYGGNTLLAHEVGAGKTFEMAASAMESKRLGLCQKSLFVVPNHLTLQWANEFLRLYPSAKLLVASKKDFETANRKKFCARIATGDYDAVIIGHSQFEKIPVSAERQERLLREQIDEITDALSEMKYQRGENFSIKQMEKTRKSLQARLDKLLAADRKDDVITFEQLGVDRLFVDESHFYKNLFLFTKMRNVAGLSTSEAQKSQDMFMKCRYMDEITGGRGVVFATGTPVSNSMTELYTVMRYLQYGTLQQKGLTHFDCWASTFGETQTAIELAPEGTGYRARTRFAKFFNLPELMNMFKEVADIKTSDQLDLPVPEAKFETVVVQPSEHQKAMVANLSERAAKVHSGAVDPSEDNMLKITSDGRKLGLDQRLMNPLLSDDPDSKLNACVNNVLRIWEEGKEKKLTQLLFCDLSTPKKDGSFNVYDDIRSKLIAAGVPEQEVAFIHTADTEAKKKELFAKVRSGQVRVLLGSTQKMGAGTNVQDRLIAVHHLDVGWRPSDMTQRNGRIIRQGNSNREVQVYQYVTEGTFDAYLYQTLENKQKFISQIMTSKSPVRSCDDVDEQALSYAEIKALCAGNPLIKEKMDLDIEVARLKVLKADHLSQRYRLEDKLLKYYPAEIEKQSRYIKGFSEDIKTVEAHPQVKEGFVGMKVGERTYTEKVEAGEAILAMCKQVKGEDALPLGEYRGFKMALSFNFLSNEFEVSLKASMSHRVSLGKDARGNLTRIDNVLAAIPTKLQHVEEQLENLTNQQEAARIEVQKPFAQEAELAEKSARLAKLDAALNIDGGHGVGEEISEEQKGGERASVLDDLKAKAGMVPPPQRSTGKEQSL